MLHHVTIVLILLKEHPFRNKRILCLRRCYAEEEAGVQERAGRMRPPPRAAGLQQGWHSAAGHDHEVAPTHPSTRRHFDPPRNKYWVPESKLSSAETRVTGSW